jgi:hypothetical protein
VIDIDAKSGHATCSMKKITAPAGWPGPFRLLN